MTQQQPAALRDAVMLFTGAAVVGAGPWVAAARAGVSVGAAVGGLGGAWPEPAHASSNNPAIGTLARIRPPRSS